MVLDRTRIQGFGSDGLCPKNHVLKQCKASFGRCDGCNARAHEGDNMMGCSQCNYYLCDLCRPQQADRSDWLWGSVSYFMGVAYEEVTDAAAEFRQVAGHMETYVSGMSLTGACLSAELSHGADEVDAKIEVDNLYFEPEKSQAKAEAEDEVEGGLRSMRAINKTEAEAQAHAEAEVEADAEERSEIEVVAPAAPGKPAEGPPAQVPDLLDFEETDLLDLDSEVAAPDKKQEPQPQHTPTDLLL